MWLSTVVVLGKSAGIVFVAAFHCSQDEGRIRKVVVLSEPCSFLHPVRQGPERIQESEVMRDAVKDACIQRRQMKISQAGIILILPTSHLVLPVIFLLNVVILVYLICGYACVNRIF